MGRCPRTFLFAVLLLTHFAPVALADDASAGFTSLLPSKTLDDMWRIPGGDQHHWKLADGVLDYDALSRARGPKHLWTKKVYREFILRFEWRFKGSLPGFTHRVAVVEPDGSTRRDAKGNDVYIELADDMQSGILLRGKEKNVVVLTRHPVGSGQIGGTKLDQKTPSTVRAASTPTEKADNRVGIWNTMEITLKDNLVSVKLNDKEVIIAAPLPEPGKEGPIGLEHHGVWDERRKRWSEAPSLVQFRNLSIREIK